MAVRILLAADNEPFREVTAQLTEAVGRCAAAVAYGRQAPQAVSEFFWELVLRIGELRRRGSASATS